jgi:hypothetical protein
MVAPVLVCSDRVAGASGMPVSFTIYFRLQVRGRSN